jgi:endopeptidase La
MKEIKGKTDDSFLKAKHYLEGLLKIPFGIIKKEPILQIVDEIKIEFKVLPENVNIDRNSESLVDIIKQVNLIDQSNKFKLTSAEFESELKKLSKKEITQIYTECKAVALKHGVTINTQVDNSKAKLIKYIKECLAGCLNGMNEISFFAHHIEPQYKSICKLKKQFERLPKYISSIKTNLDTCVYGHDEAKKQIERIVGQWISGDTSGYCFGFEGPPGVGKTTLAKKGIARCLLDEFGDSRPFAMIQLGGDSNGSSLHGHNYTYVGSTWGNIVQILMDSKCMNPIIFIDEVDKVSKTENGREIIGILTHLLDVSQNDCFQDKYFAGIDIDLSKALFILSYNDAELIDKILLDRIHRIKLNHLSLEEKIVICEKYILPEILQKMGLVDKVYIPQDLLRSIIETYTNESGVRKLKELLFNIIGDINLDILNNGFNNIPEIPIVLTHDDIVHKYLKDRHCVKHKHIHDENKIGIISGLWANALGNGGIIPIQCSFYHCSQNLNLKLTGLQGDVMKESMNVALTLAWEKTSAEKQKDLLQTWTNNNKGIHIHCPEGAVPKDGPSAGAAITTAIYSLLNNVKIKHDIAMTGEISLDGTITEIGGLDLKILGGIRAGVKQFIFPRENLKDFQKFSEKCKDKIEHIQFHPVSCLDEVFNIILDYEQQ